MIISPGRNYIFVHIPKTGGTALTLALEARAKKDDILIGDTPKAARRRKRIKNAPAAGQLWKHSTLADIDGLVPLDQIRRAFTLTLVRNPWDRIVSYYSWLKDQGFDHPAVALAKANDFTSFLNAPLTRNSLSNSPYTKYMRAADGQEYCSAYVRLEHLEADLAPFWRHLGFGLEIPVANRSDRTRDYRTYYSDADAELVSRICKDDIARFGYRFS